MTLLRISEYQARRGAALEDIGIHDNAGPSGALYMYVLDALGVPPTGYKKEFLGEVERFSRECGFDREWLDELFYAEFLLENDHYNYSHKDFLDIIRPLQVIPASFNRPSTRAR